MMRGKFTIERPGQIECTLSITATLEDWTRLKDQLSGVYPAWKLSGLIGELVQSATKEFTAKTEEAP